MSFIFTGIPFTKMHGAGNDYIYINATEHCPDNLPLLAQKISDRHFGVGADGLVVITTSDVADFRMRMFNADGSEAQMCGNASRCVAKYVYEKHLTDKTVITLQTGAGIKILRLKVADGVVESVTVDMGTPILEASRIPVADGDGLSSILTHTVALTLPSLPESTVSYEVYPVGMGNPHGVIFTDKITDEAVLSHGPLLEVHQIWPEKANIEFAEIADRQNIRMRVWERGSGETLACGTGACATVVAAVLSGRCDRKVNVLLPGGVLQVEWRDTDNHIYLTGGAVFIADGVYYES